MFTVAPVQKEEVSLALTTQLTRLTLIAQQASQFSSTVTAHCKNHSTFIFFHLFYELTQVVKAELRAERVRDCDVIKRGRAVEDTGWWT